jgi:hypothetical protein
MYLYELPTTGAISFSDFCTDHSTDKSYTIHLPQSTQARANVRGALKEGRHIDHEQKDFLRIVKVRCWHLNGLPFGLIYHPGRTVLCNLKVIEDYVPHLRGIMGCVAHDEIGVKSEPCKLIFL